MLRFVLFFLLLGSSFSLTGQNLDSIQVKGIPLSTIKQLTQDERGVYYFPKLAKRLESGDSSLLDIDYSMLYYGFIFTPAYDPYFYFAMEDSLGQLTKAEKAQETLDLANRVLKDNPVSIFAHAEKGFALYTLGDKKKSEKYFKNYVSLFDAMEASGVGNSMENPIVVITPKDPQAILLRYKLRELSKKIQGQNGHFYDVYTVENQNGKQYPIYFDITVPRTLGMQKLKERLKTDN